jgi:anti-anti-sigma regulatory factor
MCGYGPTLIGTSLADIHPDEKATLTAIAPLIAQQGSWRGKLMTRRADGISFPADVSSFLLRDHTGKPNGVAAIMRDLTEQQRAEEARVALQAQVITAQQAALRELSTPLIPIAEGVVAMPLIGSIDSGRAQLVVETLLTGSAELRAHTTIIDITGVPVVDTQVANTLLQAAQAVKLLGAHVILTGIRPEVAQTLVGLGVDLSGISTRSTLQSGIAEALGRRLDATPSRRW